MAQSMRDKILELAQQAIASRGYSSFSFRELATELGIKSASIHYYFPTKTHLGVEVARAYRERLQQMLDNIASSCPDPQMALVELMAIYRHEAATSQRMTVCTMLAAEIKTLPAEICCEMKDFYALNLDWIGARMRSAGFDEGVASEKAKQVFALLQGGLMGAKGQNNPDYFDIVAKAIPILFQTL